MALLNLILLPILAVLSLLTPGDGGGGGDAAGGGDAGAGEGAGGSGSATPPATPAATGDGDGAADADGDEPLGDAGKKALAEERAARKAAERRAKAAESERDQLKTAGQSEQEKAIEEAKKAAATEERSKWETRTIRAEAKSALAAIGAGDVAVAVAAFLDENRDLKVTDNGDVEDLDTTVKAFKQAHPTLFTARVPGGSADQGAKPPSDKRATSLEEAYERHYAPRTQ